MPTDKPLTKSEAAALRWAGMTQEERAELAERSALGRRYAAMQRHIDRVRGYFTAEQRAELAYYLAPELRD